MSTMVSIVRMAEFGGGMRALVYERTDQGDRLVAGCFHRHLSVDMARSCADKMARKIQRNLDEAEERRGGTEAAPET